MRTLLIAGNWKMNPASRAEAVALAEAVKAGVGQATTRARRPLPAGASILARSTRFSMARRSDWVPRTCTGKRGGAFTGELSAAMLVDAGCTHVILGHSERRHGMGETDAQVNRKLQAALAARLIPIVCIGETKDERLRNETERVLLAQLTGSLAGLSAEQMAGTVLAYEPVWAIGTGLTATPEQAQAAHAFIRELARPAVWRGDGGPRGCPVRRERQARQRRASSWRAPTSTGPWSAAPA